MMNIVLLCQFGASTGMLTTKIKEAADKRGIECVVNAYSFSNIKNVVDEADIILLGPQIRFKKNEFEKDYADKDVVFQVIETTDYGMMNGENILNSALKALEEK